jgi:hypothetical protein
MKVWLARLAQLVITLLQKEAQDRELYFVFIGISSI